VTRRIAINDFKPGIFSDFHAGSSGVGSSGVTVNGAAVVDGTWGCCADASGALVPLPRTGADGTAPLIPPTAASHGTYLPDTYLLDAVVIDDVQQSSSGLPGNPEVVTLQSFVYNAGSWSQYSLVRRWHKFRAAQDSSDVSFAKVACSQTETAILSGSLALIRGWDSLYTVESSAVAAIRRGFAWVVHALRLDQNPSTATQFTLGAISAGDQAITDYDTKYAPNFGDVYPVRCRDALFGWFPSFGSPPGVFMNSGAHFDGSTNMSYWGGYMCVSHQGRVVVAQRVPAQYENRDGGMYAWKDRLSATEVLQPHVFGGAGEFVEENTALIGTMASLSADELFVVKHSGGGYLLRGSVVTPTVTKLPFVESTAGVVSTPVATPIGLVYGSRKGVFVWDGGQTSKHISPQLDGFFWKHSNANYQGHQARFGWWHPWVMAPKGFMFDTRHSSWWQLDDPSTHEAYNVYATSGSGRLFAFPWRLTATQNVLYNYADPDRLAPSWSWKSQPLVETLDQAFKVRDITVVATSTSPGSSITVTVTGLDDLGAQVEIPEVTFTLADNFDRPQVITKDVDQQLSGLSYVQLTVVAGSDDAVAPKLHGVTLGVLDTIPVRKAVG